MRLHRRRNAKGLTPISALDNKRRKAREALQRSEDALQRYYTLRRKHDAQAPSLMLRRYTMYRKFACGVLKFAWGVLWFTIMAAGLIYIALKIW